MRVSCGLDIELLFLVNLTHVHQEMYEAIFKLLEIKFFILNFYISLSFLLCNSTGPVQDRIHHIQNSPEQH